MLPSKHRLTRKKDFEAAGRRGRAFSFGGVLVKLMRNDLEETRVGVVVGLKYSKKAVERNRAKRQIRAFFSKKMPFIGGGWDIIVIVRKASRSQDQILTEDLQRALKDAGLIKIIDKTK